MFNDYSDITERIAEPPKWWDEYGVPRYAEYDHYQVANIYAQETALVEIACSACWRHFEVAFSNSRSRAAGNHWKVQLSRASHSKGRDSLW